jgi:hypothetical protein
VQTPLTIRQDSSNPRPTAQMASAGVYLKDAGLISQVDIYG